ncbi:ABC transporter permease [Nitratireductor mangrovi]|uniref:ABC transporter permease n=1 Tax=Nitratireductor mangrovi TaxID=2599600 RepID=A0A5B8L4Y5_9HYPH|nr:ABC transporter permease [Nitratireductor mangrovi]QDZ02995.1 ABC transporter permease [Nitratireductor mangrovi]
MTDASLEAAPAGGKATPRRRLAPIVPGQSVAGTALIAVIAIMTFLSCLTVGAVTLVRDTASAWQTQIAREATIQIRPRDGLDMEAALAAAKAVAETFDGVTEVRIVDRDATARLLEPWLGTGLDLDELPVPRLVIVTIDESAPPDFAALRAAVATDVPGASLDDHRNWVDRLVSMARTTVTLGIAVLILMLSATVLTVVFATRGAMAGNGHVIEVLHYVGAEARFIASQFRRHFLYTGIKGAAAGGLAAIVVFIVFGWWSARNFATPEADQATALFGNFAIGSTGYAGVGVVVAVVAVLTAATSHVTVVTHLQGVDVGTTDHI